MFAIYAKDEDENIACSERYQETEFLGVFSTLEIARKHIDLHKIKIQELLKDKTKLTPRKWEYYIYSCEIDVDQKTIVLLNNETKEFVIAEII